VIDRELLEGAPDLADDLAGDLGVERSGLKLTEAPRTHGRPRRVPARRHRPEPAETGQADPHADVYHRHLSGPAPRKVYPRDRRAPHSQLSAPTSSTESTNQALVELKRQLRAGEPSSVIGNTVEKVEQLLSPGGDLVYAGNPHDPLAPDRSTH
jgi:hypothetical protein